MKKSLLLATIFLGSFLAFYALLAEKVAFSAGEEKIDNFETTIEINPDASINVKESIDYDFGSAIGKHGIYRTIPIGYSRDGLNYNLRVSDISVTDASGRPYKFQKSLPEDNINIKNINLKIGDPDKIVIGQKTYVINYKIDRAINYFDSYDELYWNVTGNAWPVRIEQTKATVILPGATDSSNVQKKCSRGEYGSFASCSSDELITQPDGRAREILFTENGPLYPRENLSVIVGFPKGLVAVPSAAQTVKDTVWDNWVLVIPFIVFAVLFYLWYKHGRDPEGRGTIIPEYDAPNNLTPAEVGTVISENADNKEISAQIIALAIKGYLKITRIEKKGLIFKSTDYTIEKLKDDVSGLKDFDQKILEGLFPAGQKTVNLSDRAEKFYPYVGKIKDDIYQSVTDEGYFVDNPKKVRWIYIGIGIALGFLVFFFGGLLSILIGGIGSAVVFVSAIMIAVFGYIMPARTRKGVEAKEYILGLKEYLSVAEKDRINFHNAPEKNPERYEKLLPYAMVLGVEQEWAKQFEGIYEKQPDWYSDPSGARFNSFLLANSLGSFASYSNDNLYAAPSRGGGVAGGGGSGFSGGGGASGGGFGGGGGGSW